MQRYTDGVDGMYEDEEGEWVKWDDELNKAQRLLKEELL